MWISGISACNGALSSIVSLTACNAAGNAATVEVADCVVEDAKAGLGSVRVSG